MRNIFGLGKRKAEAIISSYRKGLAKSFNVDLAAAPRKALFLQNLCEELQFDPELTSKMHEVPSKQTRLPHTLFLPPDSKPPSPPILRAEPTGKIISSAIRTRSRVISHQCSGVSRVLNEDEDFMAQMWKPINIQLTQHNFYGVQAKMIVYSSKSSKGTLFPLRSMLVFFISLLGFYVCYFSFTQIALENEEEEMNAAEERTNVLCKRPSEIPYEQMQYVHFPRPMSYDRGECACTPVRFFVIVSMQRSGSGWFETLLNSHPNVSSNGEIFSVRERREDIASILWTLDKLYDLDWHTSAAKNECTAAFGLKWMLNQGLMDYPDEIVDYLIKKGVMVIFLFRRNTLRRLVSVLANDHDKRAKQLNGTHKAHVHSQEEAEILARFKPYVDVSSLIPSMRSAEQSMDACLRRFRGTRHMILYYEDVIRDENALSRVQEFLGLPVRRLSSRHVKIHTSPLPDLVDNWEDVRRTLKPTEFARFLDG